MQITLAHFSQVSTLGVSPAIETFTLTSKQLRIWNARHFKFAGISFNESANEAAGLPGPAARKWLRSVHESKYGICSPSARLTWADVKNALE